MHNLPQRREPVKFRRATPAVRQPLPSQVNDAEMADIRADRPCYLSFVYEEQEARGGGSSDGSWRE